MPETSRERSWSPQGAPGEPSTLPYCWASSLITAQFVHSYCQSRCHSPRLWSCRTARSASNRPGSTGSAGQGTEVGRAKHPKESSHQLPEAENSLVLLIRVRQARVEPHRPGTAGLAITAGSPGMGGAAQRRDTRATTTRDSASEHVRERMNLEGVRCNSRAHDFRPGVLAPVTKLCRDAVKRSHVGRAHLKYERCEALRNWGNQWRYARIENADPCGVSSVTSSGKADTEHCMSMRVVVAWDSR